MLAWQPYAASVLPNMPASPILPGMPEPAAPAIATAAPNPNDVLAFLQSLVASGTTPTVVAGVQANGKPQGIPYPPEDTWSMFLFDHAGRRLMGKDGKPLDIKPTPFNVVDANGKPTSHPSVACYPDGSAKRGWKIGDPIMPQTWWSYNDNDGGINGAYRFKHRTMGTWKFADTDRLALITPQGAPTVTIDVQPTQAAPKDAPKPTRTRKAPAQPTPDAPTATQAANFTMMERQMVDAIVKHMGIEPAILDDSHRSLALTAIKATAGQGKEACRAAVAKALGLV
jgi:hypothetical protein